MSAEATLSGPAEDGLSLLAEHVLESRLAVRNFATVLLRDFKPVLARLDRRLGRLIGGVELDADHNPISPEHLGVAIHEAFAGCELAPEVHLVLISCASATCVHRSAASTRSWTSSWPQPA